MSDWVEINTSVFADNIRNIRAAVARNAEVILVVKANAYGHGLEMLVNRASKEGLQWFAVATFDEAVRIRKILSDAKIVMVSVLKSKDVLAAAEFNIVPVIVSEEHASELSTALGEEQIDCHIKIDTGMGRLGIGWESAADIAEKIMRMKGLNIKGLCTHFASSDGDDRTFLDEQFRRFCLVRGALTEKGMGHLFCHASNSGAVTLDGALDLDGVRPGIMLYGYRSVRKAEIEKRPIITRPFLTWKTSVLQVKNVPAGFPVGYDSTFKTEKASKIAIIDVGYSNGFPRHLSNKGFVLVGGRKCPVVGRVTMNLVTVDVGIASAVKVGDEAVLIGSQGEVSIWADEIAHLCSTISYEILTNIKTTDRREVGEKA